MTKPTVYVEKLLPEARVPGYAHDTDSGADLFALGDYDIPSMSVAHISTGIAISLPEGYEAQVRSKSGLAANRSLFVLNSPGTIDNGYQGEIFVILMNLSQHTQKIMHGAKVGQLVISPVIQGRFNEIPAISKIPTARGAGKFGSTGE